MNYTNLNLYGLAAIKQINQVFDASDATTSMPSILSLYQGGSNPALTIDTLGDLSIGTSTASAVQQKLCLNGQCITNFDFANATSTASTTASDEARISHLENQILGLAAPSSSLAQTVSVSSGLSSIDFISVFTDVLDQLNTLGVTVSQNLLHAVKIIADNLQIGSAAHPTGITMYDTVSGQPYCFEMANGDATTTPGACIDILPPTTATTSTSSGQASSATSTSSGAPVLQISGNNPATINVGATYTDLGATITGPTADLNLGIMASVDGATSTPISSVLVDTTAPGTHTIVYSATDQNGLTSTATRTVNVIDPNAGTSSTATSTTDSTASSTTAVSTTDASSTTP